MNLEEQRLRDIDALKPKLQKYQEAQRRCENLLTQTIPVGLINKMRRKIAQWSYHRAKDQYDKKWGNAKD